MYFLIKKENFDSLVFCFLGESWACRYDDRDIGFVCDALAPHLTHGKPVLWDDKDPVHTAHRVICWALIVSAAMSFCSTSPFLGRLFDNPCAHVSSRDLGEIVECIWYCLSWEHMSVFRENTCAQAFHMSSRYHRGHAQSVSWQWLLPIDAVVRWMYREQLRKCRPPTWVYSAVHQ